MLYWKVESISWKQIVNNVNPFYLDFKHVITKYRINFTFVQYYITQHPSESILVVLNILTYLYIFNNIHISVFIIILYKYCLHMLLVGQSALGARCGVYGRPGECNMQRYYINAYCILFWILRGLRHRVHNGRLLSTKL